MSVIIRLWSGESRGFNRYRDPGTDICTNCPLPVFYFGPDGLKHETCEQADRHGNRKSEPVCLIALAQFYGVDLDEAEEIARQVGLNSTKKITADRYAWELRQRTTRQ